MLEIVRTLCRRELHPHNRDFLGSSPISMAAPKQQQTSARKPFKSKSLAMRPSPTIALCGTRSVWNPTRPSTFPALPAPSSPTATFTFGAFRSGSGHWVLPVAHPTGQNRRNSALHFGEVSLRLQSRSGWPITPRATPTFAPLCFRALARRLIDHRTIPSARHQVTPAIRLIHLTGSLVHTVCLEGEP